MNFVCTSRGLSRHVRHLNVPYRSRHVPPGFLVSGVALPLTAPTRLACAHARLRTIWQAGRRGRPEAGAALSRVAWLNGQLGDDINHANQMHESNIVPAPGLEPGRPSFKGWWAANYPTPDQRTLLRNHKATTANPRYRPGRRRGISGSLGIQGSSAGRMPASGWPGLCVIVS
jgi:hypothetical protein